MSEVRMKYAYSLDEERYHGEFDSRGDAIAEALCSCDGQTGDAIAVWTGAIKTAPEILLPRMTYFAEYLEERLDEELSEEIGWDDAIVALTPADREQLGELILDFLVKRDAFKAWGVTDVQAHLETIPEEAG